jgi:hypothetical protein
MNLRHAVRQVVFAAAFLACAACSSGRGNPPSDGGLGVGSGSGGAWPDLAGAAAPAHGPPFPSNSGAVTQGGTLTFTSVGAAGWWGRRIDLEPGDARCDVQSEQISLPWGSESCCRTKHPVTSDRLTPFNEQQTLILDGPLRIRQLAVYQPLQDGSGDWAIRSFWDRRIPSQPFNLHLSGPGDARAFSGDLGNNCTFYAAQEKAFPCGPGSDPYCPGSALDFEGWAGSKLFVILASMPYADDPTMRPLSCIQPGQDERAEDSPWIGIDASELARDGWSGFNPCHCFANTDAGVGDGCGQINVFEVIAESSGAQWGNRDVVSTGVRSYQVGSLGGVTCGIQGCAMSHFPAAADLLDANHLVAMSHGAVIDADHRQSAEGPVWRRALDDRYYLVLLDERARTIHVAVVHPANLPAAARPLLPALPNALPASAIEGVLQMRVPQ